MAKKQSLPKKTLKKNAVKPIITRVINSPQKIIIDWKKASMDGVIVFTCYDGLNFTILGSCTSPPFEDNRKNLSLVTPESRYYILRYFKNDVPVGLESDVVKVTAEIFVPE